MTVTLPQGLVEQLRRLAATQHRDVQAVVEEALRDYLRAAGGGNCLSEVADQAQDGGLPADFAERHEHYTKGKPRA